MRDWAVAFIAAALVVALTIWCVKEVVLLLRGIV